MQSDLVYDVGVHNGNDTAFYLERSYRVVGIEADGRLLERLRVRFAEELRAHRLILIHAGIADHSGSGTLWLNRKNSEWNSFDRRLAGRQSPHPEPEKVPCVEFREVLSEYGVPYYLKVDIEGSDHLCLEALDSSDLPRYVSVELADLSLLDRLVDLGYSEFQLIEQGSLLPLLYPPATAWRRFSLAHRMIHAHGMAVRGARRIVTWNRLLRWYEQSRTVGGRNFPEGSSGPFGEELSGPWRTATEVAHCFRHYRKDPYWAGGLWCDLHARLTA